MTYRRGTKVSFDVAGVSDGPAGDSVRVGCQTFRTDEFLAELRRNGREARISGRVTGEADGHGRVTIGGRTFTESQILDVARNLETEETKPEVVWQDGDSLLYEGEFRYRHGGAWLDHQGVERLSAGQQDQFYTDLIGKGRYGVVPLVMGGKPWQPATDPATLSWQDGDRLRSPSGGARTRRNGVWVYDDGTETGSFDQDYDRWVATGEFTVLRKGGVDFTTELATAA